MSMDANLLKEAIADAKAERNTNLPSCKCADQDYCGCNGKRDIAIIANTQEQGIAFAKDRHLKMVRVHSTYNNLAGYRFGPEKTVYILTETPRLIQTLIPALQGAKVIRVLNWHYLP